MLFTSPLSGHNVIPDQCRKLCYVGITLTWSVLLFLFVLFLHVLTKKTAGTFGTARLRRFLGPLAKGLRGRKSGRWWGRGDVKGLGGTMAELGGGFHSSAIGDHCADMAPSRN